jgi:hypothetical protein
MAPAASHPTDWLLACSDIAVACWACKLNEGKTRQNKKTAPTRKLIALVVAALFLALSINEKIQ